MPEGIAEMSQVSEADRVGDFRNVARLVGRQPSGGFEAVLTNEFGGRQPDS